MPTSPAATKGRAPPGSKGDTPPALSDGRDSSPTLSNASLDLALADFETPNLAVDGTGKEGKALSNVAAPDAGHTEQADVFTRCVVPLLLAFLVHRY